MLRIIRLYFMILMEDLFGQKLLKLRSNFTKLEMQHQRSLIMSKMLRRSSILPQLQGKRLLLGLLLFQNLHL